jgi:hypothetical protein
VCSVGEGGSSPAPRRLRRPGQVVVRVKILGVSPSPASHDLSSVIDSLIEGMQSTLFGPFIVVLVGPRAPT